MTAPSRTPACVILVAYPQVDELDLFGAHAVLAKARPRLDVCIAAREDHVTTSGGVTVVVPKRLDVLARADAVVVPGGRGAQAAAADPGLRAALLAASRRHAAFYAVCSGVLILAAARLATGYRVAVHHAKRDLLRDHQVGDIASGFVRDRGLCSVGGDRAPSVKSVDLAFALLTDLAADQLDAISTGMEIAPGRGVLR